MLPILTTSRLRLRPWSDDDVDDAFHIYRDPLVNRYLGGHTVESVAAMRERLTAWRARTERYPSGQGIWAAEHGGRVIGTGLLKPLPASGHPHADDPLRRVLSADVEVGWHLGRDWWGQGFATELGRALVAYGYRQLGLDRISAVVEPPNEASRQVALRCGLAYQGRSSAYYDRELDLFVGTPPQGVESPKT